MSYARFGDHSDVYLYRGINGVECCQCSLDPDSRSRGVGNMTAHDAITHVLAHKAAGDKVPEYTIPAIVEDAREGWPWPGCPGLGRCHGLEEKCERCGDVSEFCDKALCDIHDGATQ